MDDVAPINPTAEKIIQAASDLFYRQGFTDTGVNQIIRQAGVAKASFYHHFPSKKDLAMAYIRHRHQSWFARLDAHLATRAPGSERFYGLFSFLEEWLPETDYQGCAFLNMAAEAPAVGDGVLDLVELCMDHVHERIRTVAEEAFGEKGVKQSRSILLLFEGAIVQAKVVRSVWPVTAAREAARSLMEA